MHFRPRWVLVSVAAFLCLGGGPVGADWIVTTDGEHIETRGPWEVKGRLVVMTLANGELASMRLSNVDLEASRAATDEAWAEKARPAAEETEAPAPKRSKIVLTDDDFTTVRRPPVASGDESEEDGSATAANAPALTILTSENAQDPETGGTIVSGVLANRSENALANVALTVRLFDVEGGLLEEADADLSSPSLSPGGRASFRASFPDVLAFSRVEFEPRSVELLTGSSEPSEIEASAGEGQGR